VVESRLERTGKTLVAVVATEAFAGLYDDVLFPFAISGFGPLYGGVSASVVAVIINFLMITWYRRTETDWFGFEAERESELQETMKSDLIRRLGWNKAFTFIILSYKDPTLAFLYSEGRRNRTFDARDWAVFVLANAIGVSIWLSVLTLVSERVGDWLLNVMGVVGLILFLRIVLKRRVTSR
jgi:hypothetical protein